MPDLIMKKPRMPRTCLTNTVQSQRTKAGRQSRDAAGSSGRREEEGPPPPLKSLGWQISLPSKIGLPLFPRTHPQW